jgi:hypothetical protein
MKTAVVGCLVILTININLEKGLTNKTSAYIWSMNLGFQGLVDSINLTIKHSSKILKVEELHHPIQVHLQHDVQYVDVPLNKGLCHKLIQVLGSHNLLQGFC